MIVIYSGGSTIRRIWKNTLIRSTRTLVKQLITLLKLPRTIIHLLGFPRIIIPPLGFPRIIIPLLGLPRTIIAPVDPPQIITILVEFLALPRSTIVPPELHFSTRRDITPAGVQPDPQDQLHQLSFKNDIHNFPSAL